MISGVWLYFARSIPKTQEIQGKMSQILVKRLHFMWLFPNIRDILVNLLLSHVAFSEDLGNSRQVSTSSLAFPENLGNSVQNTQACSHYKGINYGKLGSPSTDLAEVCGKLAKFS